MRAARRVAAVLLGLFVLWILIVVTGTLPRVSDAQRAALEELRKPTPTLGSANAFAALQLADRDVPDAELEQAAEAEIAAFAAHAKDPGSPYKAAAEGRYPKLDPPATDGRCSSKACLATVRADPAATRALLEKHAAQLARFASLDRYDHFANRLELRLDTPLPSLAAHALPINQAALRYVDGEVEGAFVQTCGLAKTWRRLRNGTDNLIVSIVGANVVGSAARLYAEMLAEQDVPAAAAALCDEAFAPLADQELVLCNAMRSEFRMMDGLFADMKSGTWRDSEDGDWTDRFVGPLLSREHTAALMAEHYAPFCSDAHLALIAARDPLPLSSADAEPCTMYEKAFNPMGCILAAIGRADVGKYHDRLRDLDARLRLVGAARWLRANPGADFATRPDVLKTKHHTMTYDADKRVLRVDSVRADPDDAWEIPAPAPVAEVPPAT